MLWKGKLRGCAGNLRLALPRKTRNIRPLMSNHGSSHPVMHCASLAQPKAFVSIISAKTVAAFALRHLILWSPRELSARK